MGRRTKEIDLYDYQAREDMDYTDDEEEETDQIKECLRLIISTESRVEREQVLATIISVLEDKSPFHKKNIVENYSSFVLLFQQCLFAVEKGSSKEVCMAARIIGFLALSTAYLGQESALYKSIPVIIYKHLKLPFVIDPTKTVSLLNCLTIINFLVGSNQDEEEEELSLSLRDDVIWRKVTKILGEEKGPALLAYGFFLTSSNRPVTIDVQTISYLCSLLLDCGQSKVRGISAQILGLIFELYVFTDDVRQKVLHMLNYRLAVEETKSQWNLFKKVAEFLEHGFLPISKKKDTRKDELYVQTNSWTDLIRLKFLKQFLGKNGFSDHMQNNQLLQDVLNVSHEAAETNGSQKRDGNYMWMGKKTVQRKRFKSGE